MSTGPLLSDSIVKLETTIPKNKSDDLKLIIKQKRQLATELSDKLAVEEARYTLCKKIRISQLSSEKDQVEVRNQDLKKGKQPTMDMTDEPETQPKLEPKDAPKITQTQCSSKSSRANTPSIEKTFRHIDPDIKKNSQPIKLFQPKAINGKDTQIKVKGRPTKSVAVVRDLKDIHQLAAYMAQNPQLTEKERGIARNVVFRKLRLKILAEAQPPNQPENDIIFLPSMERMGGGNEFVNLMGLEQVVNSIKLQNAKKKDNKVIHGHLDNADDWRVKEDCDPGKPYECEICGTDFTPQWFKNSDSDKEDSVFCANCVKKHRSKVQISTYNESLKSTFKQAIQAEKEFDLELSAEYNRQVKIFEEEKARKEKANQQIILLQKEQERKREEMRIKKAQDVANRAREAKLAEDQIKMLILQQAQQAQRAQQNEQQNQNNTNRPEESSSMQTSNHQDTNGQQANSTNPTHQEMREILPRLIQQINQAGLLEKAIPSEKQKILQVLEHVMSSAGLGQNEILQITKVIHDMQENQRKIEEEKIRKQQEEERKRREAERKERERQLAEQKRRNELAAAAAAAEQARKGNEMNKLIEAIVQMLAQPNVDQATQQSLMQILLNQTNNQPEHQQRIIDQIAKCLSERTQQNSSRR